MLLVVVSRHSGYELRFRNSGNESSTPEGSNESSVDEKSVRSDRNERNRFEGLPHGAANVFHARVRRDEIVNVAECGSADERIVRESRRRDKPDKAWFSEWEHTVRQFEHADANESAQFVARWFSRKRSPGAVIIGPADSRLARRSSRASWTAAVCDTTVRSSQQFSTAAKRAIHEWTTAAAAAAANSSAAIGPTVSAYRRSHELLAAPNALVQL